MRIKVATDANTAQTQHSETHLWCNDCTDHHCSATQLSEAPLCSPLPQHHLHSSSSAHLSTRPACHCTATTRWTATEMAA
jgi:alanine racemase